MGVFLHALDARTGAVRWTNDGDGSLYIKQPHQVDAFAGVAPQGRLVVVGDRLLVPGGRSVPACYDRHTGKLLHFRLADNSKHGGGADGPRRPRLLRQRRRRLRPRHRHVPRPRRRPRRPGRRHSLLCHADRAAGLRHVSRPASPTGGRSRPSPCRCPASNALTAAGPRLYAGDHRPRPALSSCPLTAGQAAHLLGGGHRGPAGPPAGRRRPAVRVHARGPALLLRRRGRRASRRIRCPPPRPPPASGEGWEGSPQWTTNGVRRLANC